MNIDKQKSMIDAGNYPSMTLAYEWVKDILTEQAKTSESLSNRASILWAIATAVIGIIVPLSLYAAVSKVDNWSWLFGSVFFYIVVFVMACFVLYPRNIETMKDPKILRKKWWPLPKEFFIEYIWQDIETAFNENDKVLKSKEWPMPLIFMFVTIETLWVVSWVSYIFWIST